jgi:hypothetical protein
MKMKIGMAAAAGGVENRKSRGIGGKLGMA